MPVPTDPQQHRRQSARLEELISDAPPSLAAPLAALRACLAQASESVPDRAVVRPVTGLDGWRVSRFAAHGLPWVGIEWPLGHRRPAAQWLRTAAYACNFATSRPDVPHHQIWVYLGPE